jgi:hypothetical protein
MLSELHPSSSFPFHRCLTPIIHLHNDIYVDELTDPLLLFRTTYQHINSHKKISCSITWSYQIVSIVWGILENFSAIPSIIYIHNEVAIMPLSYVQMDGIVHPIFPAGMHALLEKYVRKYL